MTATRRSRVPEPDRGEPGTGSRPLDPVRRERVLLAPPTPQRTGRGSRRRVWLLALGLTMLLGGALAVSAWAAPGAPRQPSTQPAAQQPPPLPLPPNPSDTCAPNSPDPACRFPTGSPRPSVPATPLPPITELPPPTSCFPGQIGCTPGSPTAAPSTTANPPCTGEDCIPQPTPPPSTSPRPGGPSTGNGDPDCGLTNITGCIAKAINGVFKDLVTAALSPILDLLGHTVLTTPTLDQLPGIGELWDNSWQIVLACYGMLILVAGIVVMSHETVQSRYSIKEIGPRIPIGFLASALSLFFAEKLIRLANALSAAVLGDGVDPPSLGSTLKDAVDGAVSGGFFMILLALVLVVVGIALLAVYAVRVVITLILIATGPLFLMCHGLPHTDGIARWWWKATGATLAIQVAQSLVLIGAVRTFLTGGVHLFGSTLSALGMLIAAIALFYVLFKIPFWFLSAARIGNGRSLLGSLVKTYIAAKTFGMVAGKSGRFGKASTAAGGKGHRGGGGRGGAAADPPWPPHPRSPRTPEAVNKRMQAAYDAERARAAQQPRPPSQRPEFLQPGPQETIHDPAVTSASQGPTMPEFSSAPKPGIPAPPPAGRHRRRAPTAPRFQAPGAPRRAGGAATPARPVATAAVPPYLRFQPPTPEPPHVSRPATPATAPPAAPVFRTAHPQPRLGDARPRTPSVPPVTFRAPTTPPAPPKAPPRGGEKS
ncbi:MULTISPECIES: hypothetical protein [Amycolatopsis]|uniref:TrbL/VirB6 plasmid conjugal transfer protein n=1 Tax=Amycolatopsis echigonensis TaxID=2576905 RepID=A0A2N3WLN2_9PSEU|nr:MULTISPECIES: hypothetical protein [Amycolatopsis]MBB2501859.1 hypothetical protein [Amycolatopsis echigonensis]MCG3751321.1 hypothetical protein [Amycolatopsis sp. Poz14]PKV94787.1 hypothetical protein ATK30_5672 [Amycolatopsis niigatensis]